ncbi:MAG TPA: FMN-binding negative transcriptional regulator, partial [Polyangiaceae bacterium]
MAVGGCWRYVFSTTTMYIPSSFQEEDRGALFDLIDHHGFATMISVTDGAPTISHVPLLLDRKTPGRERLLGHLARANPHCEVLVRTESVLAIFHGPHAYVSPAWFETHPSVPTWNYAVVHVHGKVRLLDAPGAGVAEGEDRETTRTILDALVHKYESKRKDPWDGVLPEEHLTRLLPAIVAFEIAI